MAVAEWNPADTERAKKIWNEYTARHDLSDRTGEVAGVDPASGHIWFGSSAIDIVHQMDAAGGAMPLFFFRVGYDTYLRKGGRH